MYEAFTISLNLGEAYVAPTDVGFELTQDASGVAPQESPAPLPPRNIFPDDTLTDSDTAVGITGTCKLGEHDWCAPDRTPHGVFLPGSESRFLLELFKELDALSESLRSSASARNCRRFATDFSVAFASHPSIRWAIFGDEEDGVTLVVHSRKSKRQVTFEFALNEPSINIIQIDEQMRRFERACRIDQVMQLGNAIAWLNPS